MLGSEFVFHCVVDLRGLTIVDVIILDAPYKASTSRPIKTFWGVIISDLTIISVVLQKNANYLRHGRSSHLGVYRGSELKFTY